MKKFYARLSRHCHGMPAVISFLFSILLLSGCAKKTEDSTGDVTADPASNAVPAQAAVDLTPSQLNSIQITPVGTHLFSLERNAVGKVDFDNDLAVQVFPNAQGKLIQTFAQLGDAVQKGQPLYTVDSPDLVTAESTLIGAAASYELTHKEFLRAKGLFATNFGVSQRELEQANNDEQTSEGAVRAARAAVRIFGKTDAQIDQIISTRRIDPALVVLSPIAGRVTAMTAPPGYLIQLGTSPAPYAVADVSKKWLFANVAESDSPLLRPGQPVRVKVMAYGDRVFSGAIDKVYETVDPTVHTALVRCKVEDLTNELKPGMLANFTISVGASTNATAIAETGVVREGDGTMTTWVTTDRKHFVQRTLEIGIRQEGMDEVLEGLQPGELVVSDGAVFLSNIISGAADD